MSSLALFKGVRIPEYGKFRNACGLRIKNPPRVTQNLRLSYISLHWGKFNLLVVLGVAFEFLNSNHACYVQVAT